MDVRLDMKRFPVLKSIQFLALLVLLNSCQTTSIRHTISDIRPISGEVRVGIPKSITANSTKIEKTILSNLDTEADVTITTSSINTYHYSDNLLSMNMKITDVDISHNNLSEPPDAAKYKSLENLEFSIRIDTSSNAVEVDFPSGMPAPRNNIERELVEKYKEFFLSMVKIFNKPLRQGDKIQDLNIKLADGNAFVDGRIIAIGTKLYNGRKVIVGEFDIILSMEGRNIKFDGYGYMDIRTGLWLYHKTKSSEFEIKDGIYMKVVEINTASIEAESVDKSDTPSSTVSSTIENQEQGLKRLETKCVELGFTKGTEKFGDCVMKLYE